MQKLAAQNNGFMGSRNEISIDVSDLFQEKITIQYKLGIKKHKTLLVDFSHQNIDRTIVVDEEGDSNEYGITHKNKSIGFGVLINNKKLNMPMPIGYYLGLKFERHWGELYQEKIEKIIEREGFTYTHITNLPTLIFGRGIAINTKFIFQPSVNLGFRFGKYIAQEEIHSNAPMPVLIYPIDIPFYSKGLKMQKKQDGEFKFTSYHIMPHFKIGFLF